MANATFDGSNKRIIIENGITDVDFVDIYSDWKDWVLIGDNSKYLQAISVVGGDPITGIISLGSTFFLENDWKIRPDESNHFLTINGNVYARDGTNPIVSTLGTYQVTVELKRSNLINTVNTSGGGGTADWTDPEKNQIRSALGIDGNKTSATGGQLQDIKIQTDKMPLVLGLLHHNYRVKDQVYNSNNKLLSATVLIYANADDCNNDINPIHEHRVTVTYDSNGLMNSFKEEYMG